MSVILFPKNSRWFLESISQRLFLVSKSSVKHSAEIISETCKILSENKTGAIIILKQHDHIPETNSGITLDANLSTSLLLALFNDYSPLHDGAVIITGDKVHQARVILPLANSEELAYYGTRHRAGLGLSEVCDAKIIVISEETGSISLFHKKQFFKDLGPENLHQILQLN
ncbi:MAG: DNA integrity scanning protein DisA nucleotide-binding domain protein [Bdellovibrionaceae bacterium]|nr:DNA integrity scanning protein DisA nucleotide-binding domain protein [Pseudobdellovibrionaceae bacterium]